LYRRQRRHAWQQPRDPAVRREAEAHHGRAHARGLVGEPPIAGQRVGETGAHGGAVNGGDHRLVDLDDHAHELGERSGRRLSLIARERLLRDAGNAAVPTAREPLGVAARAERVACAGEHDHSHVVAEAQIAEQLHEIAGEIPVDRVHA